MNRTNDYIIIGSGPSGVQAAQTLVEAGCTVTMIDAGVQPPKAVSFPGENFQSLRENNADQYKLWLGETMEGLPLGELGTGSQLTPSRKFIMHLVKELTPLLSENFFPMESLACGGLGEAWGLGCCAFSDAELLRAGLNITEMRAAYQTVANRIGISYTADDIEPYTSNGISGTQPAIGIDGNSEKLLNRYRQKKSRLTAQDFFMGIPALALLTQDKDNRKATSSNDLDFYTNQGNSAWRPSVMLEQLKQYPNFTYLPGVLVTHFEERGNRVTIYGSYIHTKESLFEQTASTLILAGNIMGTARIVLRSLQQLNRNIPLLCNPYTYMPCIQWRMLGKKDHVPRTSTAQLALFHDAGKQNADVAMASLYSYSSLMLFRIIQQAPLNFRDARRIMQYLVPAITIAGIHQPDAGGENRYLVLKKEPSAITGDILQANYQLSAAEETLVHQREKKFMKVFGALGLFPLKKINPGHGASIHYAGSLPFSTEEKPLHLLPNGQLSFTRNIFVADASGFNYLPAKGITFSLMANAHITAVKAMQHE
jgi:hypothetical protein